MGNLSFTIICGMVVASPVLIAAIKELYHYYIDGHLFAVQDRWINILFHGVIILYLFASAILAWELHHAGIILPQNFFQWLLE